MFVNGPGEADEDGLVARVAEPPRSTGTGLAQPKARTVVTIGGSAR